MANEYTEVLDTILKDTVPDLPGVIRAVAERELRLTMREFFEKSGVWTTIIDNIAIPTNDAPVQLDDGDAFTEVIAIEGVAIGEPGTASWTTLTPLSGKPLPEPISNSPPTAWYVSSNPDEIKVYPATDVAQTKVLRAYVQLIPAFDTTVLPRQITLKYHDAILDGFLARMYGQPNKPYSAPLVAGQKRHNFLRSIGYYSAQRKRGYNNTPNWRFPGGWRVPKPRSR